MSVLDEGSTVRGCDGVHAQAGSIGGLMESLVVLEVDCRHRPRRAHCFLPHLLTANDAPWRRLD